MLMYFVNILATFSGWNKYMSSLTSNSWCVVCYAWLQNKNPTSCS